jgi:hypothetical protein
MGFPGQQVVIQGLKPLGGCGQLCKGRSGRSVDGPGGGARWLCGLEPNHMA